MGVPSWLECRCGVWLRPEGRRRQDSFSTTTTTTTARCCHHLPSCELLGVGGVRAHWLALAQQGERTWELWARGLVSQALTGACPCGYA